MDCDLEANKSIIEEHCSDCLCTTGGNSQSVPARKAWRSTNVVKERGLLNTLSQRGAKSLSKFKLFVDRHHWANHTGCSSGYNSKRYTYLKNVNTQMCEQKNHSLRKLSASLAHTKFSNYMTTLKLWFMISNLSEKKKF